jgi:hypothetical protein
MMKEQATADAEQRSCNAWARCPGRQRRRTARTRRCSNH